MDGDGQKFASPHLRTPHINACCPMESFVLETVADSPIAAHTWGGGVLLFWPG
jgi:hypothetical protein